MEANAAIPVARGLRQRAACVRGGIAVEANAAVSGARASRRFRITAVLPRSMSAKKSQRCQSLGTLKPLGQIRNSFILAVNEDGLWIVDQHVAHERVLFERVLKQRAAQKVESQRLLMPIVLELSPAQQAVFSEIADELAAQWIRSRTVRRAQRGRESRARGSRSVGGRTHAARIARPVLA